MPKGVRKPSPVDGPVALEDPNAAPELAVSQPPVAEADDHPQSPVTQQEIEVRAYEIYLARGGGDGGALEDWLRAEQELRATRSA